MQKQDIINIVINYIESYEIPISGWLGIKNKASYPLFGFYSIEPTIEWLGTDISDSVETINYDYLINLKYSDNVPIIDIIGLNSKENLIRNAKHN